MSIALGAAFFGPQPPQQSPKQGFAPPDSSQLYSLFSAGVVAVSSISISTYKDAVTVQVGTYKDAVAVQVAAIDKEIKVIEKANDRRIDAIEKKTEAIDKKTEAILVLVVVAVVASVVAGFVLERQRAPKSKRLTVKVGVGMEKCASFFFFRAVVLAFNYPIISASPLNFSLSLFYLFMCKQAVEKIVSKQWQIDKLNSWGRSGKNWFYSRFLVMKLF